MTDPFLHTSADTMLKDNSTFLGEIQQLENLQKKELFPRKSPLKFIGNCGDLQSTEQELTGLEGFETALIANSPPRKKWLSLLHGRDLLRGKEFGLYPTGGPCAANGKTSEGRVAEQQRNVIRLNWALLSQECHEGPMKSHKHSKISR